MSSRPECEDCGERWCNGRPDGSGCGAKRPPPPRAPKFYLCFLDFETTGLDPRTGAEPIEVAALVTDDRLNELGRFESLIATARPVNEWDPFCWELHAKSGLLALLDQTGERNPVAARCRTGDKIADVLARVAPAGAPLHLAGNSVHFDRSFLRAYFPAVERRFHHRHLDVSAVRLAAEVFAPGAPALGGEKPHRAMADVLRSIEELRHWRAVLGAP